VLLAGVLATAPASASNDPLQSRKSHVDGQIDQLRETLEGASKDVVQAAVAVRTAQLQLASAQQASRAANAALVAAVAHDQDVAARLAVA
jgi:outer membrane protein TolC